MEEFISRFFACRRAPSYCPIKILLLSCERFRLICNGM